MDINNYSCKGKTQLRSLVTLDNVSAFDIFEFLWNAKKLKTMAKYGGIDKRKVPSYSILITKDKLSKSRIAFEIATGTLGVNSIPLTLRGTDIESYLNSSDLIKVIERFPISSVVVDTDSISDATTLCRSVEIPIIYANETVGACQALSVVFTLWEKKQRLSNLKACIVTDDIFKNKSLYFGLAKCGVDINIVGVCDSENTQEFFALLGQYSNVCLCESLNDAVRGADLLYCDNHSLGSDYMIKKEHIDMTNNGIFLQDIPLIRGEQADKQVYDTRNSKIYDLGENLLHILMSAVDLLGK